MPDVRGAFPNIDRRTMTAGRYEGATADKGCAVPKRRPLILFSTSTGCFRDNMWGAHDNLDIASDTAADLRRGFGSRPLRAVALVA